MTYSASAMAYLAPAGDVSDGLVISALASCELSDKRDITTYAGVTGGDATVAGVSGRTRTVAMKGRVSDWRDRGAVDHAIGRLSESMLSAAPVSFVSPVAVINTGLLQSFTVTAVGPGAIDVDLTVREVRQIDAQSVPGIKTTKAPSEAGAKVQAVANPGGGVDSGRAEKRQQQAIDDATNKPQGSILFRSSRTVQDLVDRWSNGERPAGK